DSRLGESARLLRGRLRGEPPARPLDLGLCSRPEAGVGRSRNVRVECDEFVGVRVVVSEPLDTLPDLHIFSHVTSPPGRAASAARRADYPSRAPRSGSARRDRPHSAPRTDWTNTGISASLRGQPIWES